MTICVHLILSLTRWPWYSKPDQDKLQVYRKSNFHSFSNVFARMGTNSHMNRQTCLKNIPIYVNNKKHYQEFSWLMDYILEIYKPRAILLYSLATSGLAFLLYLPVIPLLAKKRKWQIIKRKKVAD